jgi:SSS family solute:Na+ symporter
MYGSTRILDMVYFAYTLRGAIFVVLLLGIYWKKTSEKGAVYAMIITALVGFFWIIHKAVLGYYPVHRMLTETYASIIAAFVSTVAFSLVFRRNTKINQCQYKSHI